MTARRAILSQRLDACNSIINDDKVDAATRAKALVVHAYISYGIYGETDGPMANFSAATLLDPKNARAYIGIGAMHLIRKEYDQAGEAFRMALKIEPDMALAWTYLGSLAVKQGNDKEAMANYDKALSIDKRQPLANLGKADLLAKTGRNGEALAHLPLHPLSVPADQQAIRLRPQSHPAIGSRSEEAVMYAGRTVSRTSDH